MKFDPDDTIVAIASPRGRGAISIVRLSGKRALETTLQHLETPPETLKPRTACLGKFLRQDGELLDEVVCFYYPAPNSYTGEDLVEISCHGSPVITQSVVDAFLTDGLRLAEPGEFTLRAVLHGKMDLLQAEAVQDLTESRTVVQAQQAAQQLGGRLSGSLGSIKRIMLDVISNLETALEFVEEGLVAASGDEVLAGLGSVRVELQGLEQSFRTGRIIHDGAQVVLAGKPNVGKSSIFNYLTGYDGAIVTSEPGTTRDALRETIAVEGIPVTLIDTAGIRREQLDTVEHLGVERTYRHLGEADLVLFVVDCSRPFDKEDVRIWEGLKGSPYMLIINKLDLPSRAEIPLEVDAASRSCVETSVQDGRNLDELRKHLGEAVCPDEGVDRERPTMTRMRHKRCVENALRELESAETSQREERGEEVTLFHLRRVLDALAELTGEVTTEMILDEIFASFCVGK